MMNKKVLSKRQKDRSKKPKGNPKRLSEEEEDNILKPRIVAEVKKDKVIVKKDKVFVEITSNSFLGSFLNGRIGEIIEVESDEKSYFTSVEDFEIDLYFKKAIISKDNCKIVDK